MPFLLRVPCDLCARLVSGALCVRSSVIPEWSESMVGRLMIHRRLVVALVLSLVVAPVARADSIDDYIRAQMKAFNLPGLSIAIVENGKITRSGAYGLSDLTRDTPATPETVYRSRRSASSSLRRQSCCSSRTGVSAWTIR